MNLYLMKEILQTLKNAKSKNAGFNNLDYTYEKYFLQLSICQKILLNELFLREKVINEREFDILCNYDLFGTNCSDSVIYEYQIIPRVYSDLKKELRNHKEKILKYLPDNDENIVHTSVGNMGGQTKNWVNKNIEELLD